MTVPEIAERVKTLQALSAFDLRDLGIATTRARIMSGPDASSVIVFDTSDSATPKSLSPESRLKVIVWNWQSTKHALLPHRLKEVRFAQPLSHDSWVLLGTRGSDELTSLAEVTRNGTLVASFEVGLDVVDAQSTGQGEFWIAFGSEGIHKDELISQNGLTEFNQNGDLIFRFGDLTDLPPISDCYALNVKADSEVWVCYYPDFPLVKLKNKKLEKHWENFPVQGGKAIAVREDLVAVMGPYDSWSQVSLVSLKTMNCSAYQPMDESGSPIVPEGVFARGSNLYLRAKTALHVIDLNEL